MALLPGSELVHLIATYGSPAVGGLVALESMGVPVPGETALIAAAVYAGNTGHLSIVGVIVGAAAGAILGDNLGFWLGHRFGYPLLLRYGRYVRLTDARIKLGQYLFRRHGGKVVFFGRFIAVLRALAAFLAGTNAMPWPRFLAFNAAGGIVWATLYGVGAYSLGEELHRLAGPVGFTLLALAVVGIVIGLLALHRHEVAWEIEAEQALPGPLPPRLTHERSLETAGRGSR